MSANAWFIIAIVGFSLSGIALAAAVILFFKLDIPSVIGDLTGRTVAREIKAMRETNASSGDKRFRPSAVNLERGTLTEKVADSTTNGMAIAHASKRLDKASGEIGSRAFRRKKTGTIELSDAVQGKTDSGPTDVLESDAATEVLRTDGQKGPGENRAEVLRENTTEVLSDSVAEAQPAAPPSRWTPPQGRAWASLRRCWKKLTLRRRVAALQKSSPPVERRSCHRKRRFCLPRPRFCIPPKSWRMPHRSRYPSKLSRRRS